MLSPRLRLGCLPSFNNTAVMRSPSMPATRTRTAQEADEHHFIRPGYDAHFLFAIVHTLFAEGLVTPGKLTEHISGLEQVRTLAEPFTPERVASACDIDAGTIRAIARDLAA